MRSTDIDYTHPEYDNNKYRWEFFLRSYLGGEDYKDGGYLTRYVNEDKDEYNRRLDLTPLIITARISCISTVPSCGAFHLSGSLTLWLMIKQLLALWKTPI